jgi:hypothetical protein
VIPENSISNQSPGMYIRLPYISFENLITCLQSFLKGSFSNKLFKTYTQTPSPSLLPQAWDFAFGEYLFYLIIIGKTLQKVVHSV